MEAIKCEHSRGFIFLDKNLTRTQGVPSKSVSYLKGPKMALHFCFKWCNMHYAFNILFKLFLVLQMYLIQRIKYFKTSVEFEHIKTCMDLQYF